jgi:DNA invertase Pin-like site-specific DNA recombinase
MTTYAYIRVSTDTQTVENQRDMILSRGYEIDEWLSDEGVSGTKDWRKRDIERAITWAREGDTIVAAELSRLGRSLIQVLDMVEVCRQKKVRLILIREGIELIDDSPMTKLLVSIMGALAEMERNLISERTKDALARKRKEGVKLGRPPGIKGYSKLDGKAEQIATCLMSGMSLIKTAEFMRVNRTTLQTFMDAHPWLYNHYNYKGSGDKARERHKARLMAYMGLNPEQWERERGGLFDGAVAGLLEEDNDREA